jgi:RNA polymerase sigma-70 factor, ECF subfamily
MENPQGLALELPGGRGIVAEGHLVRAARDGDAASFAAIVRAETPAAYRLALSIVRSPSEAEDAVQEAFLRAWRDIRGLRDPEGWPGWFRRVTVRASLDQAKRRPRVREIDLETAEEPAGEASDPTDRLELMTAFDRLAPDDRAILALRYFADLEVPDVAAALGIPLGTAKSRLHRATERLRAHMRHEP